MARRSRSIFRRESRRSREWRCWRTAALQILSCLGHSGSRLVTHFARLRSHLERDAGVVRSATGRAIEVARAVQNQAVPRLISVRSIEAPENLLCVAALVIRLFVNSFIAILFAGYRGAGIVPGGIEHDSPIDRATAICAAFEGVEILNFPFSTLSKTELVNPSNLLGTAGRCNVKVSGLVERESAGRLLRNGKAVEHGRIPPTVTVWRQLKYCPMSDAKDVSSGVHGQAGEARIIFAAAIVDHLIGPPAGGRAQLEDRSLSASAQSGRCPVEIACSVYDHAALRIGAVRAAGLRAKVVQDGLRPACSRRTEFEYDAVSVCTASECCPINVSQAVEYQRASGEYSIRSIEVPEYGLVPATTAVRRELKCGPAVILAALHGHPIKVASAVRGEAAGTNAIAAVPNGAKVPEHSLSLGPHRASAHQQQRAEHGQCHSGNVRTCGMHDSPPSAAGAQLRACPRGSR